MSVKTFLKSQAFQFFLIFFIIILVRFFPLWFLDKTFIFGDNYSLMMPGKLFTTNWLAQGVLPLWNPEVFSGMPWVADINQSVLYPSTLLFFLPNSATSLNLLITIHLFIAYSGMYLLAKKWGIKHGYSLIAAVMWMLSTQITGSINNFSTLQSIVWLPWLGYWGLRVIKERKARWWFAVFATLQFLGGYPQHVLYGIGLGVLLSFWQNLIIQKIKFKKWFLSWLETALWVFGLSAIAWAPFVDMLLRSTRMQQSADQALVGSLNPVMLIKIAIPYFWDNARAGMKWGPAWSGQPNVAFYVTWLGLFAILYRLWAILKNVFQKRKIWKKFRQDFFALIIIVTTLIFSLGEYLPGFSIIQKVFPLFRIARYPSMVMIVTNVVLILWVVSLLQQWRITKKQFKTMLILLISVVVLSLISFGIYIFNFEELWHAFDSFVNNSLSSSIFHTLEKDRVIVFEILKTFLFISVISLGTLLIFYRIKTQKDSELRKKILFSFLILGLALEMSFATYGHLFFAPKSIYEVNREAREDALGHSKAHVTEFGVLNEMVEAKEFNNYRLLTRNSNKPYTDYGSYWEAMVVRAPFSDSFVNDNELRHYNHAKALRDGFTPNWNMVYETPVVNGYTTLLPQDYAEIWNTNEQARINFVDYIDPADEKLNQWSVKYYLVDDWFKVEEDLSFMKLVTSDERWKLYERGSEEQPVLPRFRDENGLSFSDLKIIKETPNELVLSFNNIDNSQKLIVSDRWDKDWFISVNNQKRTLNNEDGMRMANIDEGLNEIVMQYKPKWFYVGLVITALTLGLFLITNFRKR